MPASPVFGLRWPLSTATPDVPRDLENLAEDTEAGLRRHGATATATAQVRNQPVGSLSVTLSGLVQEGGYTLANGRITVPWDGRYLVVMTADFATDEITVWLGTSGSAKTGLDLGGGASVFWEGQYVFTQKLAAGAQISAPVIAASPNPYDCDVTQVVSFLGDPA